jgi:hypothetical protein
VAGLNEAGLDAQSGGGGPKSLTPDRGHVALRIVEAVVGEAVDADVVVFFRFGPEGSGEGPERFHGDKIPMTPIRRQ